MSWLKVTLLVDCLNCHCLYFRTPQCRLGWPSFRTSQSLHIMTRPALRLPGNQSASCNTQFGSSSKYSQAWTLDRVKRLALIFNWNIGIEDGEAGVDLFVCSLPPPLPLPAMTSLIKHEGALPHFLSTHTNQHLINEKWWNTNDTHSCSFLNKWQYFHVKNLTNLPRLVSLILYINLLF